MLTPAAVQAAGPAVREPGICRTCGCFGGGCPTCKCVTACGRTARCAARCPSCRAELACGPLSFWCPACQLGAGQPGTYYPQVTGLTPDEHAELRAAYDKPACQLTAREQALLAVLDDPRRDQEAGQC